MLVVVRAELVWIWKGLAKVHEGFASCWLLTTLVYQTMHTSPSCTLENDSNIISIYSLIVSDLGRQLCSYHAGTGHISKSGKPSSGDPVPG